MQAKHGYEKALKSHWARQEDKAQNLKSKNAEKEQIAEQALIKKMDRAAKTHIFNIEEVAS